MRFFSENFHESIKLFAKQKASKVESINSENQAQSDFFKSKISTKNFFENKKIPDRRYLNLNRIDLHKDEIPLFDFVSHDDLKPVGIYVACRGRSIPDGVYVYDKNGKNEILKDENFGQLIRLLNKDALAKIAADFPDKKFVEATPLLYIFTAVMERSVIRFGEKSYPFVLQDVGALAESILLHAKAKGGRIFTLGGFVDEEIAITLKLPATEFPIAALAVFPEYSETAFNSIDEGVGETAYSNRSEISFENSKYPSLFLMQNKVESIENLSKCVRIRRVLTQALAGDELPLTPPKFSNEIYLKNLASLKKPTSKILPFKKSVVDLDDFSSLLRFLDVGSVNLFGAGLLKIWIVAFDVMFVNPGVYRYIPIRRSIYMESAAVNVKKFVKCHSTESAENVSLAILFTANLNECCPILGERSYRYMQLNAGALIQSLTLSGAMLNKHVQPENFYFENDLKNICKIPDSESVIGEVFVGDVLV